MEVRWWSYLVLVLGGIAVAVLVVGLPSDAPQSLTTADLPATTTTSEVAESATTAATTIAVDTTTTVETTTTTVETTTTTEAPPSTTIPAPTTSSGGLPVLVDPAELPVVVANGSGVDGEAGRFVGAVVSAGHPDVTVTNGVERIEVSRVFFVDPFWLEAIRLADQLGLDPDTVALLEEAPAVEGGLEGAALLVYLGRDRAAE